MKTIMYSPRNSGFIFNRFQSLTRHFIHHFNFVTNIDSRHFSCKKNICFYKQKPYSKHDLFSIYNSERDDYFTYLESYLKHFVDKKIDDTMHDFLNDCFLEMIARYHLVKEMLVNHDVDYLFICTSEMYLIDLAREMNVKSIFLEHAPNFFPVNILGTNTLIPSSELKFPDYIISENQLTSRHWRYQCNQLNQSQTQIIETGLPLDNMIVPNDCVKRDNNVFTIAIFNTWLGMGSFENIFQNEFKLMTFFDQLFLLFE